MNRLKSKFQSFEEAFNTFIKSIGGELISELIPNVGDKPSNADYLFRTENIIVELKELNKDHYYNNEIDLNSFKSRIQYSLEKGYIKESELKEWFNNLQEPSNNILNILLTPLRRTIETIIRKAKEQILESRKLLQIENAVGLIFFANKENHFRPQFHEIIIKEFMAKYDSDVDGFVYFTTNRVIESLSINGEGNIWLQYDWIEDKNKQKEVSDFIFEIGRKWSDFVCKHTGGKQLYIDLGSNGNFDEQVSSIKFIR